MDYTIFNYNYYTIFIILLQNYTILHYTMLCYTILHRIILYLLSINMFYTSIHINKVTDTNANTNTDTNPNTNTKNQ